MDVLSLLSVFMVLFAVIDITGALPILLDLQHEGKKIQPAKTTAIAASLLFAFLFGGEFILNLFNIDFNSFAVAGAIVLFLLALDMILDLNIFTSKASGDADVVPLAFPLIAGPGSITTLISLRAEYDLYVIVTALALNMVVVYAVISFSSKLERVLGSPVNLIIKKFFGVILLAMSVKLFASNISVLLH